ncbi:hypothetical protein ZWY2020_027807 [Hordeum vulgare]|nr:hypothetical protein ZWY2020_027807 [Hordeum vulgare]
MGRKKLRKMQSAAQQQKGKLYIIMACIALLVCGSKTRKFLVSSAAIHYYCWLRSWINVVAIAICVVYGVMSDVHSEFQATENTFIRRRMVP